MFSLSFGGRWEPEDLASRRLAYSRQCECERVIAVMLDHFLEQVILVILGISSVRKPTGHPSRQAENVGMRGGLLAAIP